LSTGRTLPMALLAALALYAFAWQHLDKQRDAFLKANYMDYTLPSRFTGPAAMEFKGIASDFLFLKVITFLGEKIGRKEKFDGRHVDYLKTSVNTITDLDPYFWDAYLFADMMLAWDFGEYQAANEILLKARKYRKNDFRIPYYLGFNYFYFMHDNANGAKYLMEASKLPGSPSYLPNLAARLSLYAAQHRTAISFLKKMLDETKNERVAKQLTMRIKTLIIFDRLEQTVRQYKAQFNRMPATLNELTDSGLIEKIPEDPYGGRFVLLENGRVYTTSKMLKVKPIKK